MKTCKRCIAGLSSKQLAEALPPTEATRPMGAVLLGLCHTGGQTHLIMVDRYSGYLFVQKLSSTTASAMGKVLSAWWELFGFPSIIRADGGPQFRCQEF